MISSVIWNTWSCIARIFGKIVNNIKNKSSFYDFDFADNFYNWLGLLPLIYELVPYDQVACNHWSSLLDWETSIKTIFNKLKFHYKPVGVNIISYLYLTGQPELTGGLYNVLKDCNRGQSWAMITVVYI